MQTWSASDYARNAAFVPALGEPLLDLLSIAPPARVLDLGCGDGVLTAQLRARGYQVLGVDASPAMIDAACARGLDACVRDGHALDFEACFEAVFSNAALHWMTRPDEVLAGVRRALVPGGELVAELGGAGNVATVVSALIDELAARGVAAPEPWYFPSAGQYATLLERAGFRVELIAHFDRPTPLPGGVGDWIATFGQRYTHALPAAARAGYLHDVCARLVPLEGVLDYVRLRLRARKPR